MQNVGQHQPGFVQKSDKNKKEDPKKKEKITEKQVVEQLMTRLGKPSNLARVKVCNVYGDKWRVTVYTRDHDENLYVEHPNDSFFLTVDEGEIVASNPKIEKRY